MKHRIACVSLTLLLLLSGCGQKQMPDTLPEQLQTAEETLPAAETEVKPAEETAAAETDTDTQTTAPTAQAEQDEMELWYALSAMPYHDGEQQGGSV